jgi:hypothetical protein
MIRQFLPSFTPKYSAVSWRNIEQSEFHTPPPKTVIGYFGEK